MSILENDLAPLARHFGKEVEEIRANGPGRLILVKVGGAKIKVSAPELTLQWWRDLLTTLAHRQDRTAESIAINPRTIYTLPGGHRLQLNVGNHVLTGVAATIRLKHARRWELKDYALPKGIEDRLRKAMAGRENIILAGGTGTGKTAFANALARLIDPADRCLVIENPPELDLVHLEDEDLVRFQPSDPDSKEHVTQEMLMEDTVRHTPDRVIIGEMRIENTWLALKVWNVGSKGFIGTIHADSADLVDDAIITNVYLAGVTVPREVLAKLLREKIDIIVYLVKDNRTGRRSVSEIRELAKERAARKGEK